MNTADVRVALRERYCKPEWAIFFEVANSTGARHLRYADAVAMNLFPSRGLEIHGFEVKVDRRDWIKELKNPDKAEAVFKYCDRWWVVATEHVVRPDELPSTWGLIEAKNGKLRQDVIAPLLKPVRLDRAFAAALIRRAGERDEQEIQAAVEVATQQIREQERARADSDISRHDSKRKELEQKLAKVQEQTGIDLLSWTPTETVVSAIRFAISADLFCAYNGIKGMRNQAQKLIETIDSALKEVKQST